MSGSNPDRSYDVNIEDIDSSALVEDVWELVDHDPTPAIIPDVLEIESTQSASEAFEVVSLNNSTASLPIQSLSPFFGPSPLYANREAKVQTRILKKKLIQQRPTRTKMTTTRVPHVARKDPLNKTFARGPC